MRSSRAWTPDWRDAAAYAPLLEVGRAGFAWEWLRRDPDYRDAAAAAGPASGPAGPSIFSVESGAARWGLHAFEAPERGALAARPVWRRDLFPWVVEASAADGGAQEDRVDLERLARFVTLVEGACGAEHLLLSDGRRSVRIDIVAGSLRSGPVLLRYRLAGIASVKPQLLALRQLVALLRAGTFSRGLHPRERRAARWLLLLRTHDALVAGAGQREIAQYLLHGDAAEPRWRIRSPALRSRVQRLVREARSMVDGGYVGLLGG